MKSKKLKFRKYDDIFLDVIREIQPASMMEIAEALEMNNPPFSIINRLLKDGRLKKNSNDRPYTITINEVRRCLKCNKRISPEISYRRFCLECGKKYFKLIRLLKQLKLSW